MDAYLPALGIAVLAATSIVLVRRGTILTRGAVVLVALLPLHLLVVSLMMRDRFCNLGARRGGCSERLDLPVDMLWAHVALAALASITALLAWAIQARRRATAPCSAAR
jgi:hypothetical protein